VKLLFFDDFKLGILKADAVVDVSAVVRDIPHTGPHDLISGLIERFADYRARLEEAGLRFSGLSPDGLLPEIVERPDHTWFVGVQFHPELKSKPFDPHPLFAGFIAAAVKQLTPQPIKFMEFNLVGVDARDHQVSATGAALPAILLWMNQVSPFRLDLKPAGTETRFDLYYEYRFDEGGNDRLFAGPPEAGPRLLAQQLRIWLVRDACSETQHLSR